MNIGTECRISLPGWVGPYLKPRSSGLGSDENGMRLAIELANENVRRGSGGPFGAIIVDHSAGTLVSAGVNTVTASRLSIAHAEIMAISLAQVGVSDWNLARDADVSLITTCEPCAMCYGAVAWAGVRRLVCASRTADAEAAGFDEGHKPRDWVGSLCARGIEVRRDVLREGANRVFELYQRLGGEIYNVPSPEEA